MPVFPVFTLLVIGASPGAAKPWQDVLIKDVPHVVQRPDFCGEAAVEMVLKKHGVSGTQDDVFALTGLDPALGRGAHAIDLKRALDRIGFVTGDVWHTVVADQAASALDAEWSALHADLLAGVPSIVCTRFSFAPNTTEHFRLVLGYDLKRDEVIFHDPALRNGASQRMGRSDFLSLWPLKYSTDRWTVIRLRLEPKGPLVVPRRPTPDPAAYAQHVLALRERLGEAAKDFTIVVQPPFVVLGNQNPERVTASATQIVEWTRTKLRSQYFEKDPQRILDVWLLKDAETYGAWTQEVTSEPPTTPFGFYSRTNGALVMNIATGGGTLVHELVHAFMEANLDAPDWLNEGLGSLYEQSNERDGKIIGLTNWRLAGLQSAVREGSVPTFKALTSTTQHQFYSEDPGTNYAQSRYLLYYLQEKDLLSKYWAEVGASRKTDPTGYKSLQKVLGEKDMTAWQKRWEAWVLTLRFP